MNRMIIVAAAAVVGLGAAYFYTSSSDTTALPTPGASAEAATSDGAEAVDTSGILEMFQGEADAPVTVVEYASFTCPHCKSFHVDTYGGVKENYVDAGKVEFVLREVYFDRFGLWAGMVARCGGPEKYFGIVDILFKEQSDWLAGGDPNTVAANLRKIGIRAGIDGEAVDACMLDNDKAQAMVALFQQTTEADGVRGTPTFVIDGKSHSNMNYADFSKLLDGELAK